MIVISLPPDLCRTTSPVLKSVFIESVWEGWPSTLAVLIISQWSIRTNGGACLTRRPDANVLLPSSLCASSPTKLGKAHNGSGHSRTRFPLMPNEQVLKHGV